MDDIDANQVYCFWAHALNWSLAYRIIPRDKKNSSIWIGWITHQLVVTNRQYTTQQISFKSKVQFYNE